MTVTGLDTLGPNVASPAYLHNGMLALALAVVLVWGSRIYGLLFSYRGATLALLGVVAVVGSANAGTSLAGGSSGNTTYTGLNFWPGTPKIRSSDTWAICRLIRSTARGTSSG